MPSQRGTAIYNKYCIAPAPPPSQTETSPAPPPGQAEARDLNQKGIDAYNSGNYESAAKYFQQALDKLPDDPAIQQNLQHAKGQIAAKKQKGEAEFNREKQKALGQLKGISNGGGFDSPSSPKPESPSDFGLKDVPSSGGSGALKTATAATPPVDTDPNVVDLRGIANTTVDPEKLRGRNASVVRQLVNSPQYMRAINQGVRANGSGNAAEEEAAVKKLRKLEELLVLPQDKDMELLFDVNTGNNKEEQILNGRALPTKDPLLNQTLNEHPELKPELLAAWKRACDQRIQGEDAAMADAVKELRITAGRLGLPYGHLEETLAKNPKLNAKWRVAVHDAAQKEVMNEDEAAFSAIDRFHDEMQALRERSVQAKNP